MKRVAIIGAGAAGVSAARHSLAAGHQVTIFEQTDRLGGTWVYRDEVDDVNGGGSTVHTSMYKDLITNLPKEIMCFPDVPMAVDHPDSYVSSGDVLAYLDDFAELFALRPHIRYRHQVVRVRPSSTTDDRRSWELIVHDRDDQPLVQHFDAIFVCNGHLSEPRMPDFADRHLFGGNLMHSHAYRMPDRFAGRIVLVIGGGPSAVEIAALIRTHAKRVVISHHRPLAVAQISGGEQRPTVQRFTSDGVVFVNGTSDVFTDVIVCTGYKYSLPFLGANDADGLRDCGIHVDQSHSYVRSLFKECINIEHPTMFMLGLQHRVITFQLVDLQARFCLAYLDGNVVLPGREEMLRITEADMKQRWDEFGAADGTNECCRHMHMLGNTFQAQYFSELARLARLQPIQPYVLDIYAESSRLRASQPASYRMQRFRVIDGGQYMRTMADGDVAKKEEWNTVDVLYNQCA